MGGRDNRSVNAPDGNAMAHLDACHSGQVFEGLVVFMTGVALPLIAEEFDITKAHHGVIGAASLFGILVGAIGLGGLSD